jgi:dynein heavy chain
LVLNEYLDTINSLLNNGECLHLFSNDEMDGLYHAIGPSIKREYPNMVLDPKKFFNSRVKRNLHITLTLTPYSDIFKLILKDYSNMINNCQIYWIQDWTEDSLLTEAKNFMQNRLETEDLREKVAKCISDIHMYILDECRQIPWTGSVDKEIKIKETKIFEKEKGIKKEQISKTVSVSLPNWPYSKNILQELSKFEALNLIF